MKTILTIEGMHCNSCKVLIEEVAKETKGIVSCSVDFKTGKTVIEHDNTLNWNQLKKEIESLGSYKVKISK